MARQPDPGDHYSRTHPTVSSTCQPLGRSTRPPSGIYRSRSFVLVKRIINTNNAFLSPPSRSTPLFSRVTHPPKFSRGARAAAPFFFHRLHFSLSPFRTLRPRSAPNAILPKYSYELAYQHSPCARFLRRYGYFNRQLVAKYVRRGCRAGGKKMRCREISGVIHNLCLIPTGREGTLILFFRACFCGQQQRRVSPPIKLRGREFLADTTFHKESLSRVKSLDITKYCNT